MPRAASPALPTRPRVPEVPRPLQRFRAGHLGIGAQRAVSCQKLRVAQDGETARQPGRDGVGPSSRRGASRQPGMPPRRIPPGPSP
ncbi:hypothetical protein SAMN00790413_03044 [Deinococcus hopiensis KR-140]|uniref:Uncharacterized protein n=1 Tax=Deinococcus hopiensis KR-140 TaxID=695939 RepID=A0A1W1VRA2_9DEIO|nr:hypothetical protein SAMN00790413_03044 [Deinococcus hopiensis KR-140]